MPQIAKETVGVVGLVPRERVQQRTADAPIPQVFEETVKAVRVVQHERMQQRTVDAPMPQVLEETVDVGRLVLHERVQQRTAEQFESAPQHLEETVVMVRSVSHERVQQRAAEQIEGAPQSPEETVEMVRSVSRERVQQHCRTDLPVVEVLVDLAGWREEGVRPGSLIFSSHRQSNTGSVVVAATCATSPLSQITSKTKVLNPSSELTRSCRSEFWCSIF